MEKRKRGRPAKDAGKTKALVSKTVERQLNENQALAAQLWVYGKENGEAVSSKMELSELVGVSYQTIMSYFNKEWFLAEIDRLQKEQGRINKQHVARYVPEAIDALVNCMRDMNISARERISATKTILDMAGMNDKTVNVNVGGEVGVVRGGFGRDVLADATAVASEIVDVDDYTVMDEDEEEVSVADFV